MREGEATLLGGAWLLLRDDFARSFRGCRNNDQADRYISRRDRYLQSCAAGAVVRRRAPSPPTLPACVYLDRVVPRVVPGGRAVVVIHEEGPPGLRVDFDLPAERQRSAVVVGHRPCRRLRLQAVHAAAAADY